MSKSATYPGILSRPMKWRMDALWRTPECFRGPPDEWTRRVREAGRADARDFFDRCLALYRHFSIDPNAPGADLQLALKLAGAPPVPAFMEPPRNGRPSKLGSLDTIRLLIACDQCERKAYEKTGRRPPSRELAKNVAEAMAKLGIEVSDDTIRTDLLPQLTNASDAFRAGRPTAFQEQFCNVVLPVIFDGFQRAQASVDEAG
jgi:hypothetical protein